MLEFSFNPLGYLECTLRDALEAEAAETIFKRFFFNAVHEQCCFSLKRTACHSDLGQGSLPLQHECQVCSDLKD